MSNEDPDGINDWLRAVEGALELADGAGREPWEADAAVDDLVLRGLASGVADDLGSSGPIDNLALARVLNVLTARRAALASELADVARRRVALTKAQTGIAGYASSVDFTV